MCFPSKRQRDNFTDQATKSPSKAQTGFKSGKDSIKAEKRSTLTLPSTTTPSTSTIASSATTNMAPRVAIIVYSMYGHIDKMARSIQAGVKSAGGDAQIFRVPETLSDEVLRKMHAPAKPADISVFDRHNLVNYDAFLFGIPTRYGNMPAQWKTFWDATGSFWNQQALAGKYAGLFVSTASPGGGQEVTILNMMSTLAHHGIIYVPFGYKAAADDIQNLDEVHGGSPWGAGTFAGNDGSRVPTELESRMAEKQGKYFYEVISKVTF
ncbi:hypothetical protein NP233_g10864 [Leucocoprinus birnbaumii]|uniref:Flavodoxin-like domain-containing protein n=1 Tax=Leucocoprinus birnbaumii TaxID=56174 RepID=A0AAD5VNI0_9AGAR|nr:hypothetical protein NP233_g10864 [Leucocoprinus birnbaumii]